MSFLFSEGEMLLKRTVEDFAKREIAPRASTIDRTGEYPLENVRKLAKMNLLGIPIAQSHGGAGAGMTSFAISVEELAKACANTAFICGVHTMVAVSIQLFGSEDQKKAFLTSLSRGERIGAFAMTEPQAGSDAAAMKTSAIHEGGAYLLNGNKCFITNAGAAGIYLIFASTDPSKGSRGISAFVVEGNNPGIKVGKIEDKIGLRASSNGEIVLEACKVPEGNLLGKEGDGFKIALTALDYGRIGVAAMGVGLSEASLEASAAYAKERFQFGQAIASFQAIQFTIADMAVETEAAKLLCFEAACLADRKERFTKYAAMAKVYASEVALRASERAVQIHGGYGLSRELPVERYMRDAKALAIIEGTSEIQRLIIAREALR